MRTMVEIMMFLLMEMSLFTMPIRIQRTIEEAIAPTRNKQDRIILKNMGSIDMPFSLKKQSIENIRSELLAMMDTASKNLTKLSSQDKS